MKTPRKRSTSQRRYKKIYYIISEGTVTEYSYIERVQDFLPQDNSQAISTKKAKDSSISSLITKAREIAEDSPYKNDEFWILVDRDKDSHFTEQLASLRKWEDESAQNHIAISAPRFEYWLLAHVENCPRAENACSDSYVARYFPGFDRKKSVKRNVSSITLENIKHALSVTLPPPHVIDESNRPYTQMGLLIQSLLRDIL